MPVRGYRVSLFGESVASGGEQHGSDKDGGQLDDHGGNVGIVRFLALFILGRVYVVGQLPLRSAAFQRDALGLV